MKEWADDRFCHNPSAVEFRSDRARLKKAKAAVCRPEGLMKSYLNAQTVLRNVLSLFGISLRFSEESQVDKGNHSSPSRPSTKEYHCDSRQSSQQNRYSLTQFHTNRMC
jgi:hypothetical protein